MVEKSKKYEKKDKMKSEAEKKIHKVVGKDRFKVNFDLKKVARGEIDAEEYDLGEE